MYRFTSLSCILCASFLFAGCPAPKDAVPVAPPSVSNNAAPLAPDNVQPPAEDANPSAAQGLNAELAKLKAEMAAAPEDRQIIDESNAIMAAKSWGLSKDTPAPLFTLKDDAGKDVILGRYLARKVPVVVLFYRGEWCPYCNKQLEAMNSIYPEIQAAGGEVIAITPEKSEFVAKLVERHGIAFPVVSDPQSIIAEKYKVAYEVDPKVGGLLGKYGIDLRARNGTDKALLPHPAVYVIDGQGNVQWLSMNVDYTTRAEPVDVLEQVKAAVAAAPSST